MVDLSRCVGVLSRDFTWCGLVHAVCGGVCVAAALLLWAAGEGPPGVVGDVVLCVMCGGLVWWAVEGFDMVVAVLDCCMGVWGHIGCVSVVLSSSLCCRGGVIVLCRDGLMPYFRCLL